MYVETYEKEITIDSDVILRIVGRCFVFAVRILTWCPIDHQVKTSSFLSLLFTITSYVKT